MLTALLFALTAASLPGEELYIHAVDLESAGEYAEAAQAYMEVTRTDELLAPYAGIRAARTFRIMGDKTRAHDMLLELAADDGSWVRLAQFELGMLLMDAGHPEEAAVAFDNALSLDVDLWWMDQYRKEAATLYVEHEETRPQGMAYFRDVANNTIFIAPRLDAASLLAESPAPEDRMTAALALVRSRKYPEAAKVAATIAPAILHEPETMAQWRHLSGALLLGTDNPAKGAEILESVAEEYPESAWARIAMLHLARTLAGHGRYGDAYAVLTRLEEIYPGSDEAFQARLSIAEAYARDEKYDTAVSAYEAAIALYPDRPDTTRAQLALGNLHRTRGRIDAALASYDRLRASSRSTDARVEAAFWSAALRETAGRNEDALLDYRAASEDGITLYYGHRSEALLADKNQTATVLPVMHRVPESVVLPIPRNDENLAKPAVNDTRLERLRFFAHYGLPEAEWEMLALVRELEGESATEFYHAIGETGNAYSAMQIANARGWGANDDGTQTTSRLRVRYPRAYWETVTALSREMKVDPYLILAVARQESTYRPALTSHAGAKGVMQVMPATADWLAKVDPRVDAKDARNLNRPPHSLRLGAVYLNRMLEKYDGNVVYAAAAYNGGPGNCDKWIRRFNGASTADFIESIPFSETRNYVKRVLANYMTYYSVYPPAHSDPGD